MEYKYNKYSLSAQGVSQETYVNFFKKAYVSVKKGVAKSVSDFNKTPEQFDFRTLKAIWLNASVKTFFQKAYMFDEILRSKIKHLKSHGVDYYLLEGKAIVCFKKMDKKSRVSGYYSKRFKDLMEGKAIHYSQRMLNNLAGMGINKALPIYFVGHVIDSTGNLSDVRLVHYDKSQVAYEVNLAELFKPNLFSSANKKDENTDIVVTSKKKTAQKKSS